MVSVFGGLFVFKLSSVLNKVLIIVFLYFNRDFCVLEFMFVFWLCLVDVRRIGWVVSVRVLRVVFSWCVVVIWNNLRNVILIMRKINICELKIRLL